MDVGRTEGRRLHVIMDPSTPDSDSDLPFVRASTIWLIIPSPYSLIPIIWNKNSDDIYIMMSVCLFVCNEKSSLFLGKIVFEFFFLKIVFFLKFFFDIFFFNFF